MAEYHEIIWQVIRITLEAGVEVLDVYGTDFKTHLKEDQSPVTEADLRANTLITERLTQLEVPGAGILGVIAEESSAAPYEVRKEWSHFWLVDPVDGTKEFVNRNGEFTVNIGLIDGHEPVLGVILAPAKNLLYVGARGWGAKKLDLEDDWPTRLARASDAELAGHFDSHAVSLPTANKAPTGKTLRVIGSRSHTSPEFDAFVQKLQEEHGEIELVSSGSSLKFCRVAEGSADIYPRLGPTCEWDTAAGHAIALACGRTARVFQTEEPLSYNKKSLLNPFFVLR